MIQQDLGDLVTEIPVSDLKDIVIGKEDLEKIGKQPWTRGQVSGLGLSYWKFLQQNNGPQTDSFTIHVC